MADAGWSRRQVLGAGLAGAAALAVAGCGGLSNSSTSQRVDPEAEFGGTLVDPPLEMPDVTLTTVDGEPFPLRERTEGKLTMLFFGFTNCPDVCPVYLNTLARARQSIRGPGSRPTVLFVGIDVQRDTPEVLKTYLDRVDPTFIGLTGSERAIATANDSLTFAPIVIGEPDADGAYEVGHTSRAVAFTPDGHGRRLYDAFTRQQVFMKDLPRLAKGQYR
jgi:protein SCO1